MSISLNPSSAYLPPPPVNQTAKASSIDKNAAGPAAALTPNSGDVSGNGASTTVSISQKALSKLAGETA